MRKYLSLAAAAGIVLGATACSGSYGESHDHNAPAPAYDIHAAWVRIQSPGNYHTVIRSCVGKDGIYLDQSDNNSVTVVADDPDCLGQAVDVPALLRRGVPHLARR